MSITSLPRILFRTGQKFGRERILYIDRGLVVVNKPSNFCAQYETENIDGVNGSPPAAEFVDEPGVSDAPAASDGTAESGVLYPLHRLDKNTTGCLAFGRTLQHARTLYHQFEDKSVDKIYYALVRGGVESFNGETQGEIQTRITYKKGYGQITKKCGASKKAFTEWKLVGSSPTLPLSLLQLTLKTGLKHQLRIHLADFLKTPILGDSQHSQTEPTDAISHYFSTLLSPEIPLFLHASCIHFFRYRKSGGRRRFRFGVQAPLPDHFIQLCLHAGISLDPEIIRGGAMLGGKFAEDGLIPQLNGRYLHSS